MVARAFIGPPPKEKYSINHIDGNKSNNFVNNLEYCDDKYNIQHALINGLMYSKYDKELIHKICKLLETELSYNKIINILGLENNKSNKSLISDIKNNRRWNFISKNYNFNKNKNKKYNRKYDKELIHKICKLLEKKYRPIEIINELNLPNNNAYNMLIYDIKNHKRWNKISKKYKF